MTEFIAESITQLKFTGFVLSSFLNCMNLIRKWSIGLGTLLAVATIGAWQTSAWWQRESAPIAAQSNNLQSDSPKQLITIPEGSSAQAIGDQLLKTGVIRSRTAWQTWTRLQSFQGRSGGFQAGSYEVSPTESLSEIGNKIWTGKVVQAGFTIPEGWNIRQMAEYFENDKKFFTAQEFITAVQKFPVEKYLWLPQGLPLIEGFLFPDTYQIPAGATTPNEVIAVMLDRFEKAAIPIYQAQQGKDPLKLNVLQWVTLASIVEKEAVIPSERGTISGVFTNRLRQGMTLGSDPTVEYAFGITQTPEKPLTLAQVRTPHPYNTYVTPGLTPTPIASPGLASLKAALSPETTDYLYFVARYDGTHVFSKSLGDHESAQDQIRDRVDGQASPSPAASSPKPSPSPTQKPKS